jgi:hypothetical protein
VYALNPEKYEDMLTQALDMAPGAMRNILNSRVRDSPFTVKEIADYLRRNGTIGGRTQIAEEIGQAAGKTWFPLSTRFKGFDISRAVGDVIENQAKFHSFLLGRNVNPFQRLCFSQNRGGRGSFALLRLLSFFTSFERGMAGFPK